MYSSYCVRLADKTSESETNNICLLPVSGTLPHDASISIAISTPVICFIHFIISIMLKLIGTKIMQAERSTKQIYLFLIPRRRPSSCFIKIMQAGRSTKQIYLFLLPRRRPSSCFIKIMQAERKTILIEPPPKHGNVFHFLSQQKIGIINNNL